MSGPRAEGDTAIFSVAEIERRWSSVRERAAEAGLDAVLATSYPNSYYLSGAPIHPFGRPIATLVPVEGEPAMILSVIELGHVRLQSPIRDLRTYHDFGPRETWDEPRPPSESLLVHLGALLGERGLRDGRIGYEDAKLPGRSIEALERAFPRLTLVPASDLLDRLRLVLSNEELAILRAADRIADLGQEALIEAVRPGRSARELHEHVRGVMLDAVLERHPTWAFALRVTVGLGSTAKSAGHSEWTTWGPDDVVRPGRILETVIDCILWGYTGNVERAIVVGEPSERVRRDYTTMLEANERAIETVRPGVTFADVDRAAKAVLQDAGHGTRTGSGVGRGIISYEGDHRLLLADLRGYNDIRLEPGMAFSIEPDLQTDDGTYRDCTTIIVTPDGHEVDSTVRRDLIRVA